MALPSPRDPPPNGSTVTSPDEACRQEWCFFVNPLAVFFLLWKCFSLQMSHLPRKVWQRRTDRNYDLIFFVFCLWFYIGFLFFCMIFLSTNCNGLTEGAHQELVFVYLCLLVKLLPPATMWRRKPSRSECPGQQAPWRRQRTIHWK